jgi:Dual-action HEIGH metallo-peptidase
VYELKSIYIVGYFLLNQTLNHMKKIIYSFAFAAVTVALIVSCQKSSSNAVADPKALTADEMNLVKSAGFNSNWAEKRADGNYLIEGDILLTKAQLQEMSGATPTNFLIVADEEHYRTFNVVNTGGGVRTITVSLGSGFPAYYSTGLDQALARYNNLNLNIHFQRVASGGEINIAGANLGTSGGGCILGQASGFPDAAGNPSPGFTLSTSSCATTYLSTADKADEVMAHEIGHCIGFRHTDYKRRSSCGPGGGESAGTIGAVWIPGTPTNVSGSYNSWMMACVNNSPLFNADDAIALQYIY